MKGKRWWQREGYWLTYTKHYKQWDAKWHLSYVFPYQPNRWTVWDGDGDYDIALITNHLRWARFVVFVGNFWNPLGRFCAWLQDVAGHPRPRKALSKVHASVPLLRRPQR